jgi:hypothetical protein
VCQISALYIHRMWVYIAVCRLLALNVGSLAGSVSLTLSVLAPNVSRKLLLFAGLGATVCMLLHLVIHHPGPAPKLV